MSNTSDRIVVGAIVSEDGRVLMLRRTSDDFMGGLWELPSGEVDSGETVHQALIREVQEETGLVVEAIGDELPSFSYRSKSGRLTLQRNFVVRCRSGQLQLTEHDQSAWVEPTRLPAMACSDETAEVIRKFFLRINPHAS